MTTPLSMGRVALTVNDLARVSDFYRHTVGLHLLKLDAEIAQLGVDETVLLELRNDPSVRRRSPREAGLFHTAFLLPTRADLGAWTKHAVQKRAPIVGASDHAVSEAIYLVDPEGNGVEIYADRPSLSWKKANGLIVMGSDPLDFEQLIASAGSQDWQGFPSRSTIGHVHLQVGAIAPAEAFYAGILGLQITSRYPGGTFYAADHYHHHLATNIWNSRGAGMRSEPSTGLSDVEIIVDSAMLDAIQAKREDGAHLAATAENDPARLPLRDPWGTSITLIAG
jgi:catechol 2,3-dioxygenase